MYVASGLQHMHYGLVQCNWCKIEAVVMPFCKVAGNEAVEVESQYSSYVCVANLLVEYSVGSIIRHRLGDSHAVWFRI